MKRMATIAVMALAAGWPGLASRAGAAQPEKKEQHWAMTHHFKGTVESVDAAAGKIRIKDKSGKVEEFTIGGSVKITGEGRKDASLSGVLPGERVSVRYKGTLAAPEVEGLKLHRAKK